MLMHSTKAERATIAPEADVAIVGAGPYGLSLAAHLRSRGVSVRVIGKPMQAWIEQMPKGMMLKSDGFSSNLHDPENNLTWKQYCANHHIEYGDHGIPIHLNDFINYGLEFKNRVVPDVQESLVRRIAKTSNGFSLTLENETVVNARNVVIAVGVGYFQFIPPQLSELSSEFLTHSGSHHDVAQFKGRQIAVIGAGASAIDLAATLAQEGAIPHIIARRTALEFHSKPEKLPSGIERVIKPRSALGWGWRSRFICEGAGIFYYFPRELRRRVVKRAYGPSGGYMMREKIAPIPLHLGNNIERAVVQNHKVNLTLRGTDGSTSEIVADHVIAATGYKPDIRRLTFLDSNILDQVKHVDYVPVLSRNFESSISGLFFVGPIAAEHFGPVMRFTYGARFVAPRVTRALTSRLAALQ